MSPDGSVFVSVEGSKALVRDAQRSTVLHILREKDGDFYAVAFSVDGALLATGLSKGTVWLFDARTGKERAKRGGSKVLALAFSPTGEHLLVGHGTGKVELWAVDGLAPVSHFVAHHTFEMGGNAGCRWVAFSADGKRAFSLGNEYLLRSWSVPGGDEGPVINVMPAQERVQVRELKRGLLRAELPHAMHLWRLGKMPEAIRDIPLKSDGLGPIVRGLAVSPRGWIAVSLDGSNNNNAAAESALLVVDPRSGETVSRLERPEVRLGQVAFVGGTRFAVADSLGRLLLAEVAHSAKARWLEPEEEDVWPQTLMKEARPIVTLGDAVAYVGPDGSVVVETLKAGKAEDGELFLLEAEAEPGAAPKGGKKAKAAETARPEGLFEKRLAGACFLFAGRFKRGAERWNTWRKRYVEVRGEDFPAPLQRIDLGGIDSREHQLSVLDFTEARFAGADLSGLSDARLFHTDLCGADLRGARMPSKLEEVKHDAKTRWPEGFRHT